MRRNQSAKVITHGFLVAVEIEEGSQSVEFLCNRLRGELAFVEGVGVVDVEHLGEIDIYDDPETGEEMIVDVKKES